MWVLSEGDDDMHVPILVMSGHFLVVACGAVIFSACLQ